MPGWKNARVRQMPGWKDARGDRCPGDICPPGHLFLMSEVVQKLCFKLKCHMS